MNFILQTINGKVTLDMCFQMERAKEYRDWRNPNDSFHIIYADLLDLGIVDFEDKYRFNFNPKEWCPVGTVEFVETYIRTYFGEKKANNAMKPLNIPSCFLGCGKDYQIQYTGRYVFNTNLEFDDSYKEEETVYMIKDHERIKNPNNGIMTLTKAKELGLKFVQVSEIISNENLSSEWRCFIHRGQIVDIKNYSGDPLCFPSREKIERFCNWLDGSINEGTLDVYVDELDGETYVMECHKFFSCGLYGFDQLDILPIMYWRTYKELINNQ